MRVSIIEAMYAVIGIEHDKQGTASGVLYWHDNRLDAYREANRINTDGINCYVTFSPGGKLEEKDQKRVDRLVRKGLSNG
jgi:hypothetical protein